MGQKFKQVGFTVKVLELNQLRIVLFENFFQRRPRAVLQSMNLLNQPKNVRRHNQQIARRLRPRIPVGIRGSTGNQNCRSSSGFYFFHSPCNPQSTFEYVPSLIILVMNVPWRNQPWWLKTSARIAPLRNNK